MLERNQKDHGDHKIYSPLRSPVHSLPNPPESKDLSLLPPPSWATYRNLDNCAVAAEGASSDSSRCVIRQRRQQHYPTATLNASEATAEQLSSRQPSSSDSCAAGSPRTFDSFLQSVTAALGAISEQSYPLSAAPEDATRIQSSEDAAAAMEPFVNPAGMQMPLLQVDVHTGPRIATGQGSPNALILKGSAPSPPACKLPPSYLSSSTTVASCGNDDIAAIDGSSSSSDSHIGGQQQQRAAQQQQPSAPSLLTQGADGVYPPGGCGPLYGSATSLLTTPAEAEDDEQQQQTALLRHLLVHADLSTLLPPTDAAAFSGNRHSPVLPGNKQFDFCQFIAPHVLQQQQQSAPWDLTESPLAAAQGTAPSAASTDATAGQSEWNLAAAISRYSTQGSWMLATPPPAWQQQPFPAWLSDDVPLCEASALLKQFQTLMDVPPPAPPPITPAFYAQAALASFAASSQLDRAAETAEGTSSCALTPGLLMGSSGTSVKQHSKSSFHAVRWSAAENVAKGDFLPPEYLPYLRLLWKVAPPAAPDGPPPALLPVFTAALSMSCIDAAATTDRESLAPSSCPPPLLAASEAYFKYLMNLDAEVFSQLARMVARFRRTTRGENNGSGAESSVIVSVNLCNCATPHAAPYGATSENSHLHYHHAVPNEDGSARPETQLSVMLVELHPNLAVVEFLDRRLPAIVRQHVGNRVDRNFVVQIAGISLARTHLYQSSEVCWRVAHLPPCEEADIAFLEKHPLYRHLLADIAKRSVKPKIANLTLCPIQYRAHRPLPASAAHFGRTAQQQQHQTILA